MPSAESVIPQRIRAPSPARSCDDLAGARRRPGVRSLSGGSTGEASRSAAQSPGGGGKSLSAVVEDGQGETPPGPGRVNRRPVLNGPVYLDNGLLNLSIIITMGELLSGASDPDGDALAVFSLTVDKGSLEPIGTDTWLYTPARDETGPVTFSYQVSDGTDPVLQMAHLEVRPPHGKEIAGTDGDDRLIGTPHDDVIDARGGDDIVYGREGDDVIHGGDGDDRLLGGFGNDVIWGGRGNDIIWGGAGDDALFGQDGNDILEGDAGNDHLDGGAGDDEVHGGEGADIAHGGQGCRHALWRRGQRRRRRRGRRRPDPWRRGRRHGLWRRQCRSPLWRCRKRYARRRRRRR